MVECTPRWGRPWAVECCGEILCLDSDATGGNIFRVVGEGPALEGLQLGWPGCQPGGAFSPLWARVEQDPGGEKHWSDQFYYLKVGLSLCFDVN